MNISFDRNRTQKAYEAILGISVEELKAKANTNDFETAFVSIVKEGA